MSNQIGLSHDQVDQYWEDGFLVFDEVLSAEEVDFYREICEKEAIVSQRSKENYENKTVHLLGLTSMHPSLLELAMHPAIIARIVPLLGNDIQLQHSKLATKPPTKGVGIFAWHQDFQFYPHTNTDLLSVMIMLDDATPENGCMEMVKGSHKLGFLDHTIDGYFTAACQEHQHHWEENPELVVQITPKAGGISIHHTLTLHGSPANISGRSRRGIVFSYRADDAYQLADNIFNDTGILICGKRNEVVRCEAGNYTLPKRNPSFMHPDAYHPFGTAWNQIGGQVKDYIINT